MSYNKRLKTFSRDLRTNGTNGEALLWKKSLRARNMQGYQFYRQFPIGNYIVDFICRKIKLIIEIDGSSHRTRGKEDRIRQNYLESIGYTVIRFTEAEAVYRIDDVIKDIYNAVKALEEAGNKSYRSEKQLCENSVPSVNRALLYLQ